MFLKKFITQFFMITYKAKCIIHIFNGKFMIIFLLNILYKCSLEYKKQ